MQRDNQTYFRIMSFVHETLYGWFRDPDQALRAAGLKPEQDVLEVGCGPGFFTVPAARLVGAQGSVHTLDISPLAIRRVQEKVAAAGVSNVTTLLANGAQTGLPAAQFDVVFLFGLLHIVGDAQQVFAEQYRLLKPGGILAVEGRLPVPGTLFREVARQGRITRYQKVAPA